MTTAVAPTGAAFHLAWETELDRLELDVELAERLLRSADAKPLPVWEPPTLHGPMPEDLLPRARLLHERQLALVHSLTTRVTSTVRQQALADKVRDNIPVDVPVYVDVTA